MLAYHGTFRSFRNGRAWFAGGPLNRASSTWQPSWQSNGPEFASYPNPGVARTCDPGTSIWSSQGFLETCLTSLSGGFEVIRTDATDVAMTTPWIVERFDVVGNIDGRHIPGIVDPLLDAFLLEAGKEGFGNRIIPARRPTGGAFNLLPACPSAYRGPCRCSRAAGWRHPPPWGWAARHCPRPHRAAWTAAG